MRKTIGCCFFRTCFRGIREKHIFVMVLSFFLSPVLAFAQDPSLLTAGQTLPENRKPSSPAMNKNLEQEKIEQLVRAPHIIGKHQKRPSIGAHHAGDG